MSLQDLIEEEERQGGSREMLVTVFALAVIAFAVVAVISIDCRKRWSATHDDDGARMLRVTASSTDSCTALRSDSPSPPARRGPANRALVKRPSFTEMIELQNIKCAQVAAAAKQQDGAPPPRAWSPVAEDRSEIRRPRRCSRPDMEDHELSSVRGKWGAQGQAPRLGSGSDKGYKA
jgi:hypothetical protein